MLVLRAEREFQLILKNPQLIYCDMTKKTKRDIA